MSFLVWMNFERDVDCVCGLINDMIRVCFFFFFLLSFQFMRGASFASTKGKIVKGSCLSLFLSLIYRTPKPSPPPAARQLPCKSTSPPCSPFSYTNPPQDACTPLFLALKLQADKTERKKTAKLPPIKDPGDIKPPSKSQKRQSPSGSTLDLRDIKPGTNQNFPLLGFNKKLVRRMGI